MIDHIFELYANLPREALALVAGIFGLFVGSFLNVVIYRYPLEDQTVNHPKRSACPSPNTRALPFRWLKPKHNSRCCACWLSTPCG